MASIGYIAEQSENALPKINLQKISKGKDPIWNHGPTIKSKTTIGVTRSFGDISNKVGRVIPSNIGMKNPKERIPKFNTKEKMPKCKATEMNKGTFVMSFSGPEFRPEIKETEDYRDILPEEFMLTDDTIMKFKKFWSCRRSTDLEDYPPSPPHTHSLDLLSPITRFDDVPPLELKPVEEDIDIFSLPPSVWEN